VIKFHSKTSFATVYSPKQLSAKCTQKLM